MSKSCKSLPTDELATLKVSTQSFFCMKERGKKAEGANNYFFVEYVNDPANTFVTHYNEFIKYI